MNNFGSVSRCLSYFKHCLLTCTFNLSCLKIFFLNLVDGKGTEDEERRGEKSCTEG